MIQNCPGSFSHFAPSTREVRRFTEAEDEAIAAARRQGLSYRIIAAQLEGRQKSTVLKRFRTLRNREHSTAPFPPARYHAKPISACGEQIALLRSAGRPWKDIAAEMGELIASLSTSHSRCMRNRRLSGPERAAVREAEGRRYTAEEYELLLA